MSRVGEGADLLTCSFCGKSQKQTKRLIAGRGVYICVECIELCNEIIAEELAEDTETEIVELPNPREIYEHRKEYVGGQDRAKKALAAPAYTNHSRVPTAGTFPTE